MAIPIIFSARQLELLKACLRVGFDTDTIQEFENATVAELSAIQELMETLDPVEGTGATLTLEIDDTPRANRERQWSRENAGFPVGASLIAKSQAGDD